jgi:hypothetical protein
VQLVGTYFDLYCVLWPFAALFCWAKLTASESESLAVIHHRAKLLVDIKLLHDLQNLISKSTRPITQPCIVDTQLDLYGLHLPLLRGSSFDCDASESHWWFGTTSLPAHPLCSPSFAPSSRACEATRPAPKTPSHTLIHYGSMAATLL